MRRPRFTIRTLMIVVAVAAMLSGFGAWLANMVAWKRDLWLDVLLLIPAGLFAIVAPPILLARMARCLFSNRGR